MARTQQISTEQFTLRMGKTRAAAPYDADNSSAPITGFGTGTAATPLDSFFLRLHSMMVADSAHAFDYNRMLRGEASAKQGRVRPADAVLDGLRGRIRGGS